MDLQKYYKKYFHEITIPNSKGEEKQLLTTSGIAYVEKIITAFVK